LRDAFVTGGGYKYCQLGEGNAFLRVPPGLAMRPVLTGWWAGFVDLDRGGGSHVAYGAGADAFAGATYDPTSHYRAAAVFRFHTQQELTPERLRDINRRQIARLTSGVEALGANEHDLKVAAMPEERRAGFL